MQECQLHAVAILLSVHLRVVNLPVFLWLANCTNVVAPVAYITNKPRQQSRHLATDLPELGQDSIVRIQVITDLSPCTKPLLIFISLYPNPATVNTALDKDPYQHRRFVYFVTVAMLMSDRHKSRSFWDFQISVSYRRVIFVFQFFLFVIHLFLLFCRYVHIETRM